MLEIGQMILKNACIVFSAKALVVIGEECDTSKVFKQSLSIIEENYAVAAEDVVLWSELPHEHPLPITYTPLLMKDVSSALGYDTLLVLHFTLDE